MLQSLPDTGKGRGGRSGAPRSAPPGMFSRRRTARVAMPVAEAPPPPSFVQQELSSAATKLMYKGMEKLLSEEPQKKKLKSELDQSKALPELLKGYTGMADGLPDIFKIAALLAEKYTVAAV